MEISKETVFLLVEDSDAHAKLIKNAFLHHGCPAILERVKNGNDVFKYLDSQEEFVNRPIPDIILLDLNIPGIDGFEVLRRLKKYERYKYIPVVILTTSKSFLDIKKAYLEHANSYIVKPVDYEEFKKVVTGMKSYWSEYNERHNF